MIPPRILVSVSLALTIGCGRASEHATRTDSAGSTPVAERDAVDTSAGQRVTAHGIGGLQAGMTVADASAALGGALVVPVERDTAACRYVAWHGGPAGVAVMVENGRIARVDVDSSGVRTALGAAVGDSEAQVQRLYGARVAVSPRKYGDGHYLTVIDPADSGVALVFETSAGKVTRYRAGRRPQVEYVERCG